MPLQVYLYQSAVFSLEILHVIVLLLYLYKHRSSAGPVLSGNIVDVHYVWKAPRGCGFARYTIEYVKNGQVCFGESLEFEVVMWRLSKIRVANQPIKICNNGKVSCKNLYGIEKYCFLIVLHAIFMIVNL